MSKLYSINTIYAGLITIFITALIAFTMFVGSIMNTLFLPQYFFTWIYISIALKLVPLLIFGGAVLYIHLYRDVDRLLRFEVLAGIALSIIMVISYIVPTHFKDPSALILHWAPDIYLGFMTLFPSKGLMFFKYFGFVSGLYKAVDTLAMAVSALAMYIIFIFYLVFVYVRYVSKGVFPYRVGGWFHLLAALMAILIAIFRVHIGIANYSLGLLPPVSIAINMALGLIVHVASIAVNIGLAMICFRSAES